MTVKGPSGVDIDVDVDAEGNWSATLDIFKVGGGKTTAEKLNVPFLGALPFDPGVVRGGDDGVHRIIAEPKGESAKAFEIVVESITSQLGEGEEDTLKII